MSFHHDPSPHIMIGQLKQSEDSFVYVNVPDDFINSMFFLVNDPDATKPPYFDKGVNFIGARISVIGTEEIKKNNIQFKEMGKQIRYSIKGLFHVNPKDWREMSRVWFVEVESQDLEDLRRSYGLCNKLNGHSFHITIATKCNKHEK